MQEVTGHVVSQDGVDTVQFVKLPDGGWTNAEPITMTPDGFITIPTSGMYTLRLCGRLPGEEMKLELGDGWNDGPIEP
jgi:hypothetical protein